jgi:hypothetical protein
MSEQSPNSLHRLMREREELLAIADKTREKLAARCRYLEQLLLDIGTAPMYAPPAWEPGGASVVFSSELRNRLRTAVSRCLANAKISGHAPTEDQ